MNGRPYTVRERILAMAVMTKGAASGLFRVNPVPRLAAGALGGLADVFLAVGAQCRSLHESVMGSALSQSRTFPSALKPRQRSEPQVLEPFAMTPSRRQAIDNALK